MTDNSTTPLVFDKRPSSRGLAYTWIGIAAGFAFLATLYIGFVR